MDPIDKLTEVHLVRLTMENLAQFDAAPREVDDMQADDDI
jgi:hypothetical protein